MDDASEVRTEADDESGAVPRMLRVAAAVVAPTGLITGLLFYFGQLYVATARPSFRPSTLSVWM